MRSMAEDNRSRRRVHRFIKLLQREIILAEKSESTYYTNQHINLCNKITNKSIYEPDFCLMNDIREKGRAKEREREEGLFMKTECV